jgi:hypothetical protein
VKWTWNALNPWVIIVYTPRWSTLSRWGWLKIWWRNFIQQSAY